MVIVRVAKLATVNVAARVDANGTVVGTEDSFREFRCLTSFSHDYILMHGVDTRSSGHFRPMFMLLPEQQNLSIIKVHWALIVSRRQNLKCPLLCETQMVALAQRRRPVP